MSTDIEAWTTPDLAMRIVMLKALSDLVNVELSAAKTLAATQFSKGATEPARTVDDVKIGSVNKSDPGKVAKVTDMAALEEYIYSHHEQDLCEGVEFAAAGELMVALIEAGREDLFTRVTEIPDWLIGQLKKRALTTPIPGITVHTPAGVVSVRVESAARENVKQLLAAAPVRLIALEEGK